MIITKSRIRSLSGNTPPLKQGMSFVIGVPEPERFGKQLERMGFGATLSAGDTILPRAAFGKISDYNANGKEIVHRDRPKETAYRQVEWSWTEWHGHDRVEQSRIVDVPYKRYPRTEIQPPSIELSVLHDTDGNMVVTAPQLTFSPENEEVILHSINLLLEIFGECHFFTDEMDRIIKAKVQRLNWQILPPGRRPWDALQKELVPIIASAPPGKRVVIEHRLETINGYRPEFVAVGHGGFHGYVVLGFPTKNLYMLESLLYGNATYVFGADWEQLSQLTKRDIIQSNLQKDRLIHREGWVARVRSILREPGLKTKQPTTAAHAGES